MIVSIKSYFLSHKGRRPNVRRPNGRAPKHPAPKRPCAQTAAPKRRRPNGGAQTAAPKRPAPYTTPPGQSAIFAYEALIRACHFPETELRNLERRTRIIYIAHQATSIIRVFRENPKYMLANMSVVLLFISRR